MSLRRYPLALFAVLLAALLAVAFAGCGSEHDSTATPSSRLVGRSATSRGQIILSQLGAANIGVRTAPAKPVSRAPAGSVVVPYSSIIYDPSGTGYVFTNPSPLTFVEVPVTIQHIDGDSAYLTSGPTAGTKVVTVGAEELYGVQSGVLAQT